MNGFGCEQVRQPKIDKSVHKLNQATIIECIQNLCGTLFTESHDFSHYASPVNFFDNNEPFIIITTGVMRKNEILSLTLKFSILRKIVDNIFFWFACNVSLA